MQGIASTTLGHDADIGHHKSAATADIIAVGVIGIVTRIIAFTVIPVTTGLVILTIPIRLLFAGVIIQSIVIFRHRRGGFRWPFAFAFVDGIAAIHTQFQAYQTIRVLRHQVGQVEVETLHGFARNFRQAVGFTPQISAGTGIGHIRGQVVALQKLTDVIGVNFKRNHLHRIHAHGFKGHRDL